MLVAEIVEIVSRLNREEAVAVLLAEQDATVALRFAQYGYVMENGRIVLDGDARTISDNEDLKEVYLGLTGVGARKSYRDVKHYRPRTRWLVVSAQLALHDVSKHFGGVRAVSGVSVEVPPGEIISIIGPNGAGKTTLLNMISGFYHPDTGRITLEGDDVTHLSPQPRGPAQRGPDVPEHRPLPRHDRGRQPDARPARAHAERGVPLHAVLGAGPAGGGR